MANFTSFIKDVRDVESFSTKERLLSVVVNGLQSKKIKATAEYKKELAKFALEEVKNLIELIPSLSTYREKDEVFGYEDNILGIVMLCHASPAEIGMSDLNNIKTLTEIVDRERFVENAIDAIFRDGQNDGATVSQLLASVVPLREEFRKGQVYQGLLHYRSGIEALPPESKKLFADHVAAEIGRYVSSPLDEDAVNNLEVACDVAAYFLNDTVISLLKEVLTLGKNNVNYYAAATLLKAKQAISAEVIEALAKDMVYADMTYSLLKQYGASSLFPAELSDPVYLAKSDLVHWLTYPTELGKQPDLIEFLGKVKKKEEYYIFRYKSDSENLDDDRRGQWLIGWSNDEGGTFSDFDLYADFEQKTVEKTLKNIKKRLL